MQFDLTRPNTGRMLDYWLGGTHHFEMDRQLADQISATFPLIKQQVVETRRLVRNCVQYYHARGLRSLIDFGSGLPTCDNTHLAARELDPEIRVVYSDIDPITVAYGQELLRGERNVIYLQADAAEPEKVLNAPETLELLGGERRVGFVFLTLAHMMSDDQLRRSWKTLYDWAAPGSHLTMSVPSENWESEPDLLPVAEMYRRSNFPEYFRNGPQLAELLKPWKLTDEGVLPTTAWYWETPRPTRVISYLVRVYK